MLLGTSSESLGGSSEIIFIKHLVQCLAYNNVPSKGLPTPIPPLLLIPYHGGQVSSREIFPVSPGIRSQGLGEGMRKEDFVLSSL